MLFYLDVFGDSAIECDKLRVRLQLDLHKSDKTFLEISQAFEGHDTIQYVFIFGKCFASLRIALQSKLKRFAF